MRPLPSVHPTPPAGSDADCEPSLPAAAAATPSDRPPVLVRTDGPDLPVRTPGALILAGAMLVSMPLVAIQGPGNTTLMDALNALFMAVSWVVILVRKERVAFPLAGPGWVIMVASCLAMFVAVDIGRSGYVLVVDLYLYFWFVTLTHFLSRRCDTGRVAVIWTAVACLVALATLADTYFGLLGGQFAGVKRATGTFENPNMFGNFLVVSLFLAAATAAGGRPLLYLALPLLFFGIRATASNGALLAVLGGLGAMALATRAFWKPRTLGVLLVLAAITIGVVGVWHEEIETVAIAQLSGSRGEVGGAALKGASGRLPIWETVFLQLGDNPFGVGPGNFSIVNAATTGDYHGAHNEYLGMLGERGFLGLAGWLGLLAGVLAMGDRIRTALPAGFRPFGIVPLVGLFGAIFAHSLVIELSHFRHFWMLLALVAASAAQATRAQLAARQDA